MIHVGFTGTRKGMTEAQYNAVHEVVVQLIDIFGPISVHHGACVGADAEFHAMCSGMGLNIKQIYQHVPRDTSLRADLTGGIYELPLPYDERNQAIVDDSHLMIAAPLEEQPQARGGTWQTVRFARTKGNLWRIVFPSGVTVKD